MLSEQQSASVIGLVSRYFIGLDYNSLTALALCSSSFHQAVLPSLYAHIKAHQFSHPQLLVNLENNTDLALLIKTVEWHIPQGSIEEMPGGFYRGTNATARQATPDAQRYIIQQRAIAAFALAYAQLRLMNNLVSLSVSIAAYVGYPIKRYDTDEQDTDMQAEDQGKIETAADVEMATATSYKYELSAEDIEDLHEPLCMPSIEELKQMPFLNTIKFVSFEDKTETRPDQEKAVMRYPVIGQLVELFGNLESLQLRQIHVSSLQLTSANALFPKLKSLAHRGLEDLSSPFSMMASTLLSLDLQLCSREGESLGIEDFIAQFQQPLPVFPKVKRLEISDFRMGNEEPHAWATFLNVFPSCEYLRLKRQMVYKQSHSYLSTFVPAFLSATNFAQSRKLHLEFACDTFPSYTSDKISISVLSDLLADPRIVSLTSQWDLGDTDEVVAILGLDEDEMNRMDTTTRSKQLNLIRDAIFEKCKILAQAKNGNARVKLDSGFEFYVNDGVSMESCKIMRAEVNAEGGIECSEV